MNKLKAKIVERGLSMPEFFEQTGIDRNVWYRRCRKGPGAFRIAEVAAITRVLALTDSDLRDIFLT